ncbi:CrcB-like protein-domain-containing protein [Halteromyces radiatus]|uniref:CrcB-like protein-domain-containing protein n=1 Tax=Halteromyces radiatus TaxID=101107 RepID=UPI00221F9110|nr:CrcB-like protein-domain-containing protein [Halteromyces radiatus]KAI8089908.1 CrcB-like protein-domain-containing protein [Halteromyces radiatus]
MEERAEEARQAENREYRKSIQQNDDLLRRSTTFTVYEKKLVIGFLIIPFAIAGALIRVGLQQLETYNGAPVFPLIYAQWLGCVIMGIVTIHKHYLFFLYHPIQAALSSGLCGSITTFSSWQLAIFEAFANTAGADHTRGKNILDAISQLLVTLAMSFTGYQFGHHIGIWLEHLFSSLHNTQETIDKTPAPHIVSCGFSSDRLDGRDYLIITLGGLCWLGVVLAAIFAPMSGKQLALTCVFAPVGALMRWYLSFYNAVRLDFYVGTFSANLLGTLFLAVLSLLRSGIPMTSISCFVLGALADGLCGCLTTISTFVVELTILPNRQSYIYGATSIVLGQCLMFLVFGCYIWTHGVNPTC